MRVTKEYMEHYAKLSLISCYDARLTLLEKEEEPDWVSKELNIGIEVTEALDSQDGRKRSIVNRYFGKRLEGKFIKEQFANKYPEYNPHLRVVGKTAVFSECYDMKPKIDMVCSAIATKTQKLNSHYTIFAHNWLYIFAPTLFCVHDVPEVIQSYQKVAVQHPVAFDRIFLNAGESIFVLSPAGLLDTRHISDDCLKQIKEEAQRLASETK